MKNELKISKLTNRFTNMMMQLLHWMAQLELSGGILAEHDIGQRMSESSVPGSINDNYRIRISPDKRKENDTRQPVYQHDQAIARTGWLNWNCREAYWPNTI